MTDHILSILLFLILFLRGRQIAYLVNTVDELKSELESVIKDRNAAVKQLYGTCSACKHYNRGKCKSCVYETAGDATRRGGDIT